MIGEGFLVSIANFLGIPLGAKRGKAPGNPVSKSHVEEDFLSNSRIKDFVNSIIDITKDDICIGEVPLFYKLRKRRVGKPLRDQIDSLSEELNKIVQGAAIGILKKGYAVYTYHMFQGVDDKVLIFRPYLKPMTFYLDHKNDVIVLDEDGTKLLNTLCFIYYEQESLSPLEGDDLKNGVFRITPAGLQIKNAKQASEDLASTEASIQRLRAQMRYIRFATVEVGVNKGDQQTALVEDISEGLNANSQDLQTATVFDDQIQVFPTRKGLGSPVLNESVPSVDIGNLTDLDYNLSKMFLAMRFPKTYADFSQNLSQTAVSMIRGDIRYNKLLTRGRTIIESTINRWIDEVPLLKEIGLKFYLTTIPSPEDDDVTQSLSAFTDFTMDVTNFILGEEASREEARARLDALTSLYSNSTNLKSVERWIEAMIKLIEVKYSPENQEEAEELNFEGEGTENNFTSADEGTGSEDTGSEDTGGDDADDTGDEGKDVEEINAVL